MRRPNGYLNVFLDRAGVPARSALGPRLPRRRPASRRARPSSSTRRSTRTRPRTSATCATPRSATRSSACCASAARRSKCRTTSTTPASRSPTSSSASASSSTLARRRAQIADTTRFDYYCWDLYARVTEWYGERQGAAGRSAPRRCTTSSTAATTPPPSARFIADRIVRAHLKTMARLNIDYDLLTWEGDILRLQFWARAFEVLKATGRGLPADRRQARRLLGDDDRGGRQRRGRRGRDAGARRRRASRRTPTSEPREKVIVRSNGVVTYVGKDIANQFWKFGLLGRDFRYRRSRRAGRRHAVGDDQSHRRGASRRIRRSARAAATSTTSSTCGRCTCRSCSGRRCVAARPPEEAEHSHHFSYEMVALSHATARELGFAPPPDSEEAEEAVRRGVGPQGARRQGRRPARPLIDKAARRSRAAQSRARRRRRAAHRRADRRRGGALLHDQVLARQGDRVRHRGGAQLRGRERPVPAVRGRPRQQHLPEAAASATASPRPTSWRALPALPPRRPGRRRTAPTACGRWCSRPRGSTKSSSRSCGRSNSRAWRNTPSGWRRSSTLLPRLPILNEERDDVRRWRAAAVVYVRHQLTRALDLMGIDVPADVERGCLMPTIAITPCRQMTDYVESVTARQAATALELSAHRRPARRSWRAATGCCSPAAATWPPSCTARRRTPPSRPAEPGRDDFEIALVRRRQSRPTCRSSRSAAACRC